MTDEELDAIEARYPGSRHTAERDVRTLVAEVRRLRGELRELTPCPICEAEGR